MRLKEVLEEKHKKAKVLAQEIGTDEPMISKFANYKCLPIPTQMEKICNSLDCEISDIYKDEEVYYKQSHKTGQKRQQNKVKVLESYNLCVRLPREACKYLTRENLCLAGLLSGKTSAEADLEVSLLKLLKITQEKMEGKA